MFKLSNDDVALLLTGHADLRFEPDGVQPLRHFPVEAVALDPLAGWTASMTSGVRLRLLTNSDTVRLTLSQCQAFLATQDEWPRNFEVYVDGKLHLRAPATGGGFLSPAGGSGALDASFAVDGLGSRDKTIEIWFPQATTQLIKALEVADGSHWRAWPAPQARTVFHGSSITHGLQALGGSGTWSAVASRLAATDSVNLGWAGSCLLSGVAALHVARMDASGIVLELGINVWDGGLLKARTFADSAHAMLSIIRHSKPDIPVVVVSPILAPAREAAAEGEGLSLTEMRTLLKKVVDDRVAAGDTVLMYLSGLDLLGTGDASLLVDGVHPGPQGHELMGQRFFQATNRFLAAKAHVRD